ncbi:FAD-binding oxidoreductase [Nocardioides sp. GY 10127]|uniref:FAD-binding oxidoreductase n=1 Tax=Nocardioides sp. GY 10127 TaxID=2569762 RepID=UPI0010A7C922|nr:FAD-binding oxidoreductase [Nocardioides sp. GY 10127]TIC81705.1 FAD-binding oxidoreductase [Nocardioides sp. GY 10127]
MSKPARFKGQWLTAESGGFAWAQRIYNSRLVASPRVIARCGGVNDVRSALAYARENGLEVAVRSGGHSQLGFSSVDDAMIIDMRPISWVRLDPSRTSAWVGGGALARDIAAETLPFGVAAVTGTLPSVGIAGLSLGTGQGHLSNRYGFSCDNILAAEMVLADGTVTTVTAESDPDLFWAIRGAGANFGIVTALQVRLHPVPEQILGGQVVIRPTDVREAAQWVYDHMDGSPDQPCASWFRDDEGPLVALQPCHHGPFDEAEKAVDAFRGLGEVLEDDVRLLTYRELDDQMVANEENRVAGAGEDSGEDTENVWWMAHDRRERWEFLTFTDDEKALDLFAEAVLERGEEDSELASHRSFEWWWTQPREAPEPPSAQPHDPSKAGLGFCPTASWTEAADDEAHISWVDGIAARFREAGVIGEAADAINHMGTSDQARIEAVYGSEAYARLGAIKHRVDPENVFRHNMNIPPVAPS